MNWKQVSEATNVGPSTLARMSKGKRPDANALAALSAWAGVNPADFVPNAGRSHDHQDTLADIYRCLRRDPNLSAEATAALDEVIKATYERLRRKG
jgi:transcriptional regulator with XRE-family HTH domain